MCSDVHSQNIIVLIMTKVNNSHNCHSVCSFKTYFRHDLHQKLIFDYGIARPALLTKPLHRFLQDRAGDSDIQAHESLTSRIECFTVIEGEAGLVYEKVHQLVMSEAQPSAVKPYEK